MRARRLQEESEREASKAAKKDMENLKGLSKKDKVQRLNDLLAKSIAYSEFLANKIKKEGEDGVVEVQDGAVSGPGLSQPKLVKGNMRPYQLVSHEPSPSACTPALAHAREADDLCG